MDKKKSVILSIIIIVFIVVTFSLTSVMWFQNKEDNPIDRIQAKNLDIEFLASQQLNQSLDDLSLDYVNLKTYETPLFDFEEYSGPGTSLTRYVKVENSGDVDIDFFIEFRVSKTSLLEEVIEFNIEKIYPNKSLAFSFLAQEIYDVQLGGDKIKAGEFEIYAITVSMLEEASNDYNLADEDLSFEFDIFLYGWESNDSDTNELSSLLENINLTSDYRQLKLLLTDEYLSQFSEVNPEDSVILETRVLKDLILNRPNEGFSTISHFDSYFSDCLIIHDLFLKKIASLESETIDFNLFNDCYLLLKASLLEKLSLSEEERTVESLLKDLFDIISYIENDSDNALFNYLEEDNYVDYFQLTDKAKNFIL